MGADGHADSLHPSSCPSLLELRIDVEAQMHELLQCARASGVCQVIQESQQKTFLELVHERHLIPLQILADHLEVSYVVCE